MTTNQHDFDVIIVGGGVAAGACATTLRDLGFTGSVAVACAEPHPPYTRPGLTKQVLRGEKPAEKALWRPAEWYDENNVELLTGQAVTDLDARAHNVRVAGRTLSYGTLVLATGADPRSLDLGAAVRDRVHLIRSFADADRVRPLLGDRQRWLVIGGGFIGSEFAASARLTGSTVDQVMLEPLILSGPFGEVAARWFDERQRAHGVRVHAETSVSSIESVDDALQVTLSDGSTLTVDHVCVGIGVAPNTGLAQQAGLELDQRGIATDAFLRTSQSDVYAIGDVAAYDSQLHGSRVRIEHWDVARAQGAHVATQIVEQRDIAFTTLPYFFGTMGDWAFLEYVGTATNDGIARDVGRDEQMAVAYLDEHDVLVGMLTVNRAEDLAAARTLIDQHARMDRERLADAEAPLEQCQVETTGAAS